MAAFCRPTLLATTDTVVETPAPRLLLRSGVHQPGWFFQKGRLLLIGPTSLGDLQALDYAVRPGFTSGHRGTLSWFGIRPVAPDDRSSRESAGRSLEKLGVRTIQQARSGLPFLDDPDGLVDTTYCVGEPSGMGNPLACQAHNSFSPTFRNRSWSGATMVWSSSRDTFLLITTICGTLMGPGISR